MGHRQNRLRRYTNCETNEALFVTDLIPEATLSVEGLIAVGIIKRDALRSLAEQQNRHLIVLSDGLEGRALGIDVESKEYLDAARNRVHKRVIKKRGGVVISMSASSHPLQLDTAQGMLEHRPTVSNWVQPLMFIGGVAWRTAANLGAENGAYILNAHVVPGAQGQGLGSAMLMHALSRYPESGNLIFESLRPESETSSSNVGYEQLGMQPDPSVPVDDLVFGRFNPATDQYKELRFAQTRYRGRIGDVLEALETRVERY